MAIIGPRTEGWRRVKIKLPLPEIPESRRIWAVIVVPMLAPIIMPTVCSSFITPALTKPTHMTVVVAEE